MIRFSENLITTFDGVSMGQLVNACKTLARGICMDVQRKSMRTAGTRARRSTAAGTWMQTSARARGGRPRRRRAASSDGERGAEARDFLDWALPQIERRAPPRAGAHVPRRRAARDRRELGINRDNAYQRRSRGMKDLTKLKERYDA